jgi:prenyltransferase beta subunit
MTTAINHPRSHPLRDLSPAMSPASSHLSQDKLNEHLQDRFGLKVAAQLSLGNATLPHDVSERLRVARMQAVVKRKRAQQTQLSKASAVYGSDGSATMSFGEEGLNLWNRLASMLPLIVLVVGLAVISLVQSDQRAQYLAEVDAAMLTDYLPPAAYADPGFVQFLNTDMVSPQESVKN